MQKIHFSTTINAPVETVWKTMFDETTYSQWTKPFDPSSRFIGNWEEGSEIRFIGSQDDGKEMGMYSRIKENRLHEYVSIEHIGIIEDGVIDTTSDKVKKWAPSFENYTFKEVDGVTEVSVDMDIDDEYKEMFEDLWPKALAELKTLSEKARQ